MIHSVFEQRVPKISQTRGNLGYLSLPHFRSFHCLVQCLTGMATKLLTLGARYLLSKYANVLPLAEGLCLLSIEDRGWLREPTLVIGSEPAMELWDTEPGIFQATPLTPLQSNWVPNWDPDSYWRGWGREVGGIWKPTGGCLFELKWLIEVRSLAYCTVTSSAHSKSKSGS